MSRRTTWGDTKAPHGSRLTGKLRPSQGGAFALSAGPELETEDKRACPGCGYTAVCACPPPSPPPPPPRRDWEDYSGAISTWAFENMLSDAVNQVTQMLEFRPLGRSAPLFAVPTRDLARRGWSDVRHLLELHFRTARERERRAASSSQRAWGGPRFSDLKIGGLPPVGGCSLRQPEGGSVYSLELTPCGEADRATVEDLIDSHLKQDAMVIHFRDCGRPFRAAAFVRSYSITITIGGDEKFSFDLVLTAISALS